MCTIQHLTDGSVVLTPSTEHFAPSSNDRVVYAAMAACRAWRGVLSRRAVGILSRRRTLRSRADNGAGRCRHDETISLSCAVLRLGLGASLRPLQPLYEHGPRAVRCALGHIRVGGDLGARLLAVRAILPRKLVLADDGRIDVRHCRYHPARAVDH